MASTQITGRQIADGSIERSDINISAAGKALIRKIIVTPSTGITISSYTGADSGTGDVTLAIDTNTIATRAWVQAQGYLTSNDGYISNVALHGNDLQFTGIGNAFSGNVDLSSLIPTEVDTLATVTSRGAVTSTPVTFNGNVTLGNNADLIFQDLAGVFPTTGKGFDWTLNNDGARIYAIQPSSDSIDLVFQLRDNATTNDRFVFWVQEWRGAAFDKYPLIIRGGTEFDLVDAGLFIRGTQVITNGRLLQNVTGNISMFANDSAYITAAALAGYATQTYVNTQIANLVDSAPSTLDTLNELAAALGDDPNFATTVTNSIATKVPQSRTLTINGVTYDLSADRSWTISTADGYIQDVQLVGNELRFAGAGSAFTGNIDLAQLGYLTSFTETDPTVPAHVKSITTTEKSNWNTAYGWGNHASAGYQPSATAITTSNIGSQSVNYANSAGSATTATHSYRGIVEDTRGGQRTPTDYDDYRVSWEFTNQIPGLSGNSTWWSAMTIQGWHNGYAAWQIIGPASSAIEDFYLRSGNNDTWNTSRRIWHNGDFSSTNVSNWNTAYSWGNHASAGYATQSWVQSQGYLTSVSDVWVNTTGDTMTGELVFSMSAPQIRFADTDHYDHWIHVNSNRFYILSDRNGDGAWETPYPLELNSENNTGYVFSEVIATRPWVTSQGYLTSLPAHNHDGVYLPINPDGDGPAWSYADENPTINGKYVGGGQRFGADGDNLTGGFLQARHINAYDGHVNATDGYFVGLLEYGANSGTHVTTQVIDSGGRWVGVAIADNKIASSGNWNTAYSWGNHSGLYLPISGGNATGWVSFSSHTQGTPIIKAVQQDTSSGYYLFQGVTGSSEVFRVDRAGDIYMAGNLVATRNWVQSQGYLTSVSDVWVNTTGDTMTGDLRFNQGAGYGRIAYADNYHGMILRGIPNNAAGDVTVGDYTSLIQHSGDFRFYRTNGSINELYFQVNASAAYWRGNTIWHSGNDGAGSGLDADTLDGFNSAQAGGDIILRTASNGYLYINNWIHPANGTGLFYDSGPHFYESGGQMYSSHELRVNANILITDGQDNNRFTKGSSFLNLRDPWNNLHMRQGSGGGQYFDAGHFYLRSSDGSTNWLYLDSSNFNVYREQNNYARVLFRYNTDRYSQAWYNTTTGAYWWVTTDADRLGFHRNGDGDKFYFSNGGDFYSTTNGWLSTALAGKSNTGHTHDDRYYTESESDARFVNVAGDTMTGDLYAPRVLLGSGTDQGYVGSGGLKIGRTDTNYTQGNGWGGTSSTMFIDCERTATITIHDSAHRLVEYMTFEGDSTNIIYSGRDIGWGTTSWFFGADITVNGTITENSSIRYKENVRPLESVSDKIAKVAPVRYNKKGGSTEEIGFIAEDMATIYPEVVKFDAEGRPDGINYTRLSAILIKAVQELTNKVNELEKKA